MDHPEARIRLPGPPARPEDREKAQPLRPVQGIGWLEEDLPAPVEARKVVAPVPSRALPLPAVLAMPDWEELVEWRGEAATTSPSPMAAAIEQVVAGRLASPAQDWLTEDDEPTDPRVKVPMAIADESEGLHARFRGGGGAALGSRPQAAGSGEDDDIDLLEELDFDEDDEDLPTLRNP